MRRLLLFLFLCLLPGLVWAGTQTLPGHDALTTADAADLIWVYDSSASTNYDFTFFDKSVMVAKGTLTAGAANAFAFTWQNPHSSQIIVLRVIVEVTTAGGTASSVLDVGPATSATGTADTMLDGIDLNAAAVYDQMNDTDNGTNGVIRAVKRDAKDGTNDYITGKILTQNASSLVGKYYIIYMLI